MATTFLVSKLDGSNLDAFDVPTISYDGASIEQDEDENCLVFCPWLIKFPAFESLEGTGTGRCARWIISRRFDPGSNLNRKRTIEIIPRIDRCRRQGFISRWFFGFVFVHTKRNNKGLGKAGKQVIWGSVPAGQWTTLSFGFDELNPGGHEMHRFNIREISGADSVVYYVDNIRLIGAYTTDLNPVAWDAKTAGFTYMMPMVT